MYQRILVPIDGSETSDRALQEALKLANDEAQVYVVYVLEEVYPLVEASYETVSYSSIQEAMSQTGKRVLEEAAEKLGQSGVKVETALLMAEDQRVSTVIANEAKDMHADLIVIGTHGRSGLSRLLLGSVAEGVVRQATVPVLLIRSE